MNRSPHSARRHAHRPEPRQEVERLKKIGATVYEDPREPGGMGLVRMADPEGNLFCVERSAPERVY